MELEADLSEPFLLSSAGVGGYFLFEELQEAGLKNSLSISITFLGTLALQIALVWFNHTKNKLTRIRRDFLFFF